MFILMIKNKIVNDYNVILIVHTRSRKWHHNTHYDYSVYTEYTVTKYIIPQQSGMPTLNQKHANTHKWQ